MLATRRSRIVAVVVLLVVLLCTLSSSILGFIQLSQAKSGLAHFKNAQEAMKVVAQHPFDAANIALAHDEFVAANHDFGQVQGSLGPVSGVLGIVPVVGGATRLIPIATEGAQAGALACDMLTIFASKLKDPLNPSSKGLTNDDMAQISDKYDQLYPLANTLLDQVAALQPGDLNLDPRLGPLVGAIRPKVAEYHQLLDDLKGFIAAAPTLLGTGAPTNFMVEQMDSTELRPSGGFIGNYGILTLAGGRLSGLEVKDVDLLDSPFKYGSKSIAYPDGYDWFKDFYPKSWSFRDSNLDADFATSAKYGQTMYTKEGGTVPFQGVIAITPWLIKNALSITGNIDMRPKYNVTITPENMIDTIHYEQLGVYNGPDDQIDPATGTSIRKSFSGYLFKAFMAKIKEKSSQDISSLMKLLVDSIHRKDIQIYLNDPKSEALLLHNHLGAAIEAPATGDSLFVVDANIGANKANVFVVPAMTEKVTIDEKGTATHQTVLTYTWPPNTNPALTYKAENGVGDVYHSHQRIYVPPTSVLGTHTATPALGPGGIFTMYNTSTEKAFNRQVWSSDYRVFWAGKQPGVTTITLTWTTPNAATQAGSGWHYTYLMQKQSGDTFTLDFSLKLPKCAQMTSAPPTGFTAPDDQTLTVKQPFDNDIPLAVDYHC